MTQVRKAVIPAAGLGTRFLPVTKASPKEMLAIIDKPAIQYVVEEAVEAGIEDVIIVTSRGKSTMEDHFDRRPELEAELERKGKTAELAEVIRLAELAQMHFVRQAEPLGLGHAVSMARPHVGNEPFVVLLGDDIMDERFPVLREMVSIHERTGASVLSCKEFPPEEIGLYGTVAYQPRDDGLLQVTDLVEKPPPGQEPSSYGVMGRYVFSPGIFDALDRIEPGRGGELQLTDAIALLLETEHVIGHPFVDGRYDVGNKLDYLRATVELALARDDLGPPFRTWLAGYVREQGIV